MDDHRLEPLRLDQRGIGGIRDCMETGEVGDEREQHPADHHRLAPDPV